MSKLLGPSLFLGLLVFATAAGAANFVVEARPDNTFSPANLTIRVGDTVTFNNVGGNHNVRATSGETWRCAAGCDDTGGNGESSGSSWTFTRSFDTPGSIQYVCDTHVAFGMTGTIVVQAGAPQVPGEVRFTASVFSESEASGARQITVERVGGRDGEASIDYATSDGSATQGQDYTATSGTLSWPDQDSSNRSFSVSITNDTEEESAETVNLSLSNPTGAALGSPSSASLRILDDDSGEEPQGLSFVDTTLTVGEESGSATVAVRRAGGTQGMVSVDYATSDGSATEGADYTAASGTLIWSDGDGEDKSFSVTILDDSESEGSEMVNLALSNPTGGASLGPDATATLVIRDDDQEFPDCVSSETVLCLGVGGRFQVTIRFTPPEGQSGAAGVVDIGRVDSGLAFFFSENNLELLVKVLDGCSINDRYWVFFAATTDVEFTVTVVDTQGDMIKTYTNPQGQSADAITDTDAFATCP